jgi:putative heme iron utilization protein
VRYVGGFGRMSWVDPVAYQSAEPDPLRSAAASIIAHMNEDHADALVVLCHHFAGRPDVLTASMTAVDRYGLEVVADLGQDRREALRIGFHREQVEADGVRQELIGMLRVARSA